MTPLRTTAEPVAVAVVAATAAAAGALLTVAPRAAAVAVVAVPAAAWAAAAVGRLPTLAGVLGASGWWGRLWILLFLSGLVLRIRPTSALEGSEAVDGAALFRIALVTGVACALIALTALGRGDLLAPLASGLPAFLLAYCTVNLASAAWSVQPAWTLYRSLEFGVDAALAAVLVAQLTHVTAWRRMFDLTWLLLGGLLLTVAVGVATAPDLALVEGLGTLGVSVQGVFPHVARNGVGQIGAILAVVAVARLATGARGRGWYAGLLVVSSCVLVISQTRSALVPALVAVLLVLAAAGRIAVTAALLLSGAVALAATSFGGLVGSFLVRDQNPEQLANLSSRLDYWSYAWDALAERPLTGYGAYAGGRFEVAAAFGDEISSTHGTFPEVLIGTSIWGALPIAFLLLGVWFVLLRGVGRARASGDLALWALAVEAIGVLAVLTGRSFFTVTLVWHPALEFLLVVAFAEYLRRRLRAAALAGRSP